jgi:hypothetical protein
MKLFGVRFMENVPDWVRETCERYGEQVIGTMLAGGFNPSTVDLQGLYALDVTRLHTRDWLTERTDIQEYRERWIPLRDFILEILVICLIGWEIHLGYQQDKQQAINFSTEQKLLNSLAINTQTTANTLASLQRTTESMNGTIERELVQSQRSATASERSAKASESSSKTAVDALHISERAYVSAAVKMNAPLKAGEKLSFTTIAHNSGKTTATEVSIQSRSWAGAKGLPLTTAHQQAFAMTVTGPTSETIIPSQQAIEQPWELPEKLDDNFVSLIKSKAVVIYVFVELTYRDGFKARHHTQVCEFYYPETEKMAACESLNTTD